ncbi:VPLPA-CTERM sorting domain-containing protein [Desulfosarcina ovata]|uniref:PEP-CTERM protein-sorting domain-containing protein n=1 Tax=Desulfosarcina ovata subsp. ovata TaxID=2752305 RepID=A0A5K8AJH0_9BACT|nr:VPLPA-CTERM sorting domain-containing protein [Desulfosarcina ovata]BBO92847.1 hypothetical protein DSCOOX_60270 [Desulfosarcina ovata subsp. ovata]
MADPPGKKQLFFLEEKLKKLITILATALVVFAGAGNAMANFTIDTSAGQSTLALSIYTDTVEIGYELGYDVDLTLAQADGTILATGIDVSDTSSTVAIYSAETDYASFANAFAGVTATTKPTGIDALAFVSVVQSIYNSGYENLSGPVTIDSPLSDNSSAAKLLGTTGYYAGLIYDTGFMPTLSGIDTDGYIDIYIYNYAYGSESVVTDTDWEAIITIYGAGNIDGYSAGDVVLNATHNTVPVPAAVWLLSSGLIGLVGIRRKNS